MAYRIIVRILGIFAAISLIVIGIEYPVPEKRVSVSSRYEAYDYDWTENTGAEYLGGDCYNYQVEASLKAGFVSGILAMKAIFIVGGTILFFMSLYSNVSCRLSHSQNNVINGIYDNTLKQIKIIKSIKEDVQTERIEENDI